VERLVVAVTADAGPAIGGILEGGARVGFALDWAPDLAPLAALIHGLLADDLAAATAAKPGPIALGSPAVPVARDLAFRLAEDGGVEWVLHLVLERSSGHIVLRGTLERGRRTIWELGASTDSGVRGHYFARERLDAELRHILTPGAPPRALDLTLRPLETGGRPVTFVGVPLALAAGDVDHDDRADIVLLFRDRLEILRTTDADPVTVSLSALERAPAVARTPLGALGLVMGGDSGAVVLSTTDHPGVWRVVLDLDGLPAGPPERVVSDPDAALLQVLSVPGVASTVLLGERVSGTDALAPSVEALGPAVGSRRSEWKGPGRAYGFQRAAIKSAERGAWSFLDAWSTDGGQVVLTSAASRGVRYRVGAAGAAFVVVDLDDDGQPECVATSDALPPASDALRVYRLSGRSRVEPVSEVTLPPVAGLAAFDVDDDGAIEVLALVERSPGQAALHVLEAFGGP
jgi:hypothetical protein